MRIVRGFLILLLAVPCLAQNSDKPKVRAITAFVRMTPSDMDQRLEEALTMLRSAKAAYEKRGYVVETVRITTQPFPEIVKDMSQADALALILKFDSWAQKESVDANIGPAKMHDSDANDGPELLKQVLTKAKLLNTSMIVADETGIHWNSVRSAAAVVKYVSEHSERSQGTFNFAATAMLSPYAPFYPGSYHTGAGREFAIGLEGANVVQRVFGRATMKTAAVDLGKELSTYALECEAVAKEIAKTTGWTYKGLDPTPAPQGKVSIGSAIESLTKTKFGGSGTMTAVAAITQAVKSVPVQQIGYSGLMLPVLEDDTLAQRWSEATYDLDSVLAYSAVCGTGLDTVPLSGDVTEDQLARIIGDMATLAYKWKKPLTARLQPVAGKKAGERTDFNDPYLTNAVLQPLP
jgi:uncharacterized protein (UPF0210 family)